MSNRSILVTGGAGFIGSHLVDRHLAAGDRVVVVDDFSTGSRLNLPAEHPGLTVTEGSVDDADVIDRAMDGADLVYHLAATVGVFAVLERPLDAMRSNLRGSDLVFERAAESGIRTLFTSTSEVYGKNDASALAEGADSVFGPTSLSRWLYGVSKAADEFLGLAYHRERGLPLTIVRLFNTTGPRQTGAYGMVLPRLVAQARHGEPMTVYGDGSQTRCFTNVHDAVEAIVRLAATDAAVGEVVNVGQPMEISIEDLARRVRDIVGSRSEIVHVAYSDAYLPGFEDMRRRVPDVTRLHRLAGFVPAIPLDETIRQIIAAQQAAEA
jgi:UDP-glucose 4-epimerase